MKQPAFQMYARDWLANVKLRRCTPAARGAWIDVMCLMHGSDEYGVLRWPIVEIARAINVPVKLLKELAERDVLKGAEKDAPAFVYTPRHAGKDGEPVELLPASQGPCWYCSRMVRDEYLRQRRGADTRFGTSGRTPSRGEGDPPKGTPTRRQGARQGDGPAVASASANPSSKGIKPKAQTADAVALPDWLDADVWQEWRDERKARRKPLTPRAERAGISSLAELRKAGQDPARVIRQSIANGWSGLFEVKRINGNGTHGETERDRRHRAAREFVEDITGRKSDGNDRGTVIDGDAERIA